MYRYWGEEFRYDEDLVSIREGGIISQPPRSYDISKDDWSAFFDINDSDDAPLDTTVTNLDEVMSEEEIKAYADPTPKTILPPGQSVYGESAPFEGPHNWNPCAIIVADPFVHIRVCAT